MRYSSVNSPHKCVTRSTPCVSACPFLLFFFGFMTISTKNVCSFSIKFSTGSPCLYILPIRIQPPVDWPSVYVGHVFSTLSTLINLFSFPCRPIRWHKLIQGRIIIDMTACLSRIVSGSLSPARGPHFTIVT